MSLSISAIHSAYTPYLTAAQTASEAAYAPYSQFKVGAAVWTTDGQVITGVNVENASYGLSHCAERTALFTAVAQGLKSKLAGISLWANDVQQQHGQKYLGAATPCGACRQVMSELLPPEAPVVFVHPSNGQAVQTTVSQLLPGAFTLSS
ncbi:MAG: cytidine deaminase [Vampirovibrionales bacterium]